MLDSHPSMACKRVRSTVRSRSRWIALLTVLLLAPPIVMAQPHAPGENPSQASAAVDFRIVIPETIRFVRNQEQRERTQQYTSRTVEAVDGRQVVTVARP
ncbi:hypothetical protein [Cognatilysobacter bugurensis]|uniref:Uncharacterized protein n=1 Tax=Cognatilysobacter bugurensis TaxID=543356 RepID=A0A918W672_9GAMM|nr:hypothetical protein [Lysobacter bugurensis]GHA70276.1 hypothetical protein GCM10007067_02970 [Lysobacter bugurensis]